MKPPNIVWITLDATRVDRLSCCGYPRPTTPVLERFRDESVCFTQALSAAVWTLPSFATFLTGRYPSEHQCDRPHPFLDCETPTLAEILQGTGYSTFFLSNNGWVSDRTGFARGFDVFWKIWQLVQSRNDLSSQRIVGIFSERKTPLQATMKWLSSGNILTNVVNAFYSKTRSGTSDFGAARVVRLCDKYLRRSTADSKPRFLMIHILEPHLPYRPPEPFRSQFLPSDANHERLRNLNQNAFDFMCGKVQMSEEDLHLLGALYDGGLAYTDKRLGELFDVLRESGIWDNAAIIVTADHGEHLGEHGLLDHQYSVYEELLRVPLLIKLPGGERAGETVTAPVSSIDHFQSILELADLNLPEEEHDVTGQSYLGSLSPDRATFAEYAHPQPQISILRERYPEFDSSVYARWLRTVRQADRKLIVDSNGKNELYDLARDPEESMNLEAEDPGTIERLSALIHGTFLNDPEENVGDGRDIDKSTRRRLEDLGYL